MEALNGTKMLKQTQIGFFLNLTMTVFSFSIFIKAMDNDSKWRMITSGIGLTIFLVLTISVFLKMLKLRGQQNEAQSK